MILIDILIFQINIKMLNNINISTKRSTENGAKELISTTETKSHIRIFIFS